MERWIRIASKDIYMLRNVRYNMESLLFRMLREERGAANMMTQTEYDAMRQEIVEKNANLVGLLLNKEESRMNAVLEEYKQQYIQSCEGNVPYHMPVLTDSNIWNSRLYQFLKAMPKGSDLHVHGTSLLPMWRLIDFVLAHETLYIDIDTCILHLQASDERKMPLKEAFYQGYLTRKQLEKIWTVNGADSSQNVWNYFENLFSFHGAIDEDMTLLYDYYVTALRYYVESRIYHAEIHILLSEDPEITMKTLRTVRAAYYTVKREHPELIVSVIGCSMKMEFVSLEEMTAILENTLLAQKNVRDEFDPEDIRDFVIGFDLINEEDNSRPLKEYAMLLMRFHREHPDFHFYLHCGESLNAQSDNLIDAYLIGASRVGHGMNLYRYPNLLKCYADQEICLESCLISNQTLGYTQDIRLHPSAEYLKRGVTIALCSDDPAYQEHETLTDDFFAAAICWNLGLADLKQLALNSITYSGLPPLAKRKLMHNWHEAWKRFVEEGLA